MASDANVLVLDEPTNHLDLDAREALEDALVGFGGALLLVSHDRALLDAVGTRTVALEDGSLRSYEGGWAEYLRAREEREQAPASAEGADAEAASGPPSRPARRRTRRRRLAELEREVERAEASLRKLEDELADPSQLELPDPHRRVGRAPRRGEARRRGGLRPLGGGVRLNGGSET